MAPTLGVAGEQLKVDVKPAPVQELTYAFYRVVGPANPAISAALPWLRQLEADPPEWFTEAREAFVDTHWTRYEPLLMASALGYALDDSPDRFLNDLPGLARLMVRDLDALNIGGHEKPPAPTSSAGKLRKQLASNFEQLGTSAAAQLLQRTLTGLWAHLEPDWILEGRETAQDATTTLLEKAGTTGDVLQGLPPHHFVSLETSVAEIRLRGDHIRLVVAPLYFASMGGFKFEIDRVLYLGFGVRSERLFHERRQHVHDLAANLKAFADPTRLMLLVLVSRLRRFPLTVGDLARQLGVSQPTASGHLRLLRDLELVDVVKRGNRSYYRIREARIEAMLDDLKDALVLGYMPNDD